MEKVPVKDFLHLAVCVDPALKWGKALSKVKLPDNVEVLLSTENTESNQVGHIVISMDREQILSLLDKKESWTFLVYVGKPEELFDSLPENLPSNLAIWPQGASEMEYGFRFHQLVVMLLQIYEGKNAEAFLLTMIDSMPELVWFKDVQGAHWLVNKSFCRTVRKSREDVTGRGHYYIWDITPEEYEKGEFICMESEKDVMRAGRTCVLEEPVRTKDGMKHFLTYKTPVNDSMGKLWGTVGVAHDLTDFSNMGVEMNFIFETLPLPIVVCNPDKEASFVNTAFKQMFAQDADSFDYNTWLRATFCEDVDAERHKGKESFTVQIREKGRNGRYFLLQEQAVQDYFGKTIGFYCMLQNITREIVARKRIERLSYTDELTGLYNRRYLMEFLDEHIKESLSIVFLDADNFKLVNDRYGHKKGDEVLRILSACLKKNMPPDSMKARYGGDEFAVVLVGSYDEAEIKKCMDNMLDAYIEQTKELGLPLSISFGHIRSDEGDMTVDALFTRCDSRMYQRKEEHHRQMEEAGVELLRRRY